MLLVKTNYHKKGYKNYKKKLGVVDPSDVTS